MYGNTQYPYNCLGRKYYWVKESSKISKEYEDGDRGDFGRKVGKGRPKNQELHDNSQIIERELLKNSKITTCDLSQMSDIPQPTVFALLHRILSGSVCQTSGSLTEFLRNKKLIE